MVIPMRPSFFHALFLGLLLSPFSRGQSVHWDPPGGQLPAGQSTSLQLIFEDCEPKGSPAVPKVSGLVLEYSGQASNMSWVNGTYSHSVTYSYTALLEKKTGVEIPPFEVETNKGSQKVAAARFDSTTATVGSTGRPLESAANSTLNAAPSSAWAGEIVNLDYRIQATRSYSPDFGHGVFDWNPEPFLAEDWSQPQVVDLRTGGEPQTGLVYRTRAIVHRPGSYHLNPVSQLVNLSVGVSGLGFFQQRQYQQFSVISTAPTLEVRPLPPPPAGFSGAVGSFKFVSKVVPARTTVGEPVTWTLELSGTGNWPDITGLPARDVSKDFQVVQPKAKRTPAQGKIFDSTLSEDAVLVPTRAGTYAIEPVSFVYFDPGDGEYKTLIAPGATVTVAAPAISESQAPESPKALPVPAGFPTPPAGLPRDVLPESGAAATPLSGQAMAVFLAGPALLLLLFWLWLALRRAQQTDPQRVRREARSRLAATLAQMRRAGSSPNLILQWQHDSAILWEIDHAAPSAQVVGASPAAAWAELWAESERALYRRDTALTADWVARAEAALASKPAPKFAPHQLFLPRNLFPFLAMASILLTAGWSLSAAAAGQGAESARMAYRRSDFAAAEKGWRNALADEPADGSARHNLSLALAQQNRWDEAAAQAAAAFVQEPGDEAVRWQFALACEKADVAPTTLAAFLNPDPVRSLARLASPAAWRPSLSAFFSRSAIGTAARAKNGGSSPRFRCSPWRLSSASPPGLGGFPMERPVTGARSSSGAAACSAPFPPRPIPRKKPRRSPPAPWLCWTSPSSAGCAFRSKTGRPAGCGKRTWSDCGGTKRCIAAAWHRPRPAICTSAMPGLSGSPPGVRARRRAGSSCAMTIWTPRAFGWISSMPCSPTCAGSASPGTKAPTWAVPARRTVKA